MALTKALVNVSFAGGIDTKTNDKLVVPGNFLGLKNALFQEVGSPIKRNGYKPLPKETFDNPISSAVSLSTFNKEILLRSKNNLFSYLPSSAKWQNKGRLETVFSKVIPAIKNDAQQINPDMDEVNDHLVYAWEDSRGGVRATITDKETNTPIINDFVLNANGSFPKVTSYHNITLMTYVVGTELRAKIYTFATTGIAGEVVLANDVSTDICYDVVAVGNVAFLVYNSSTGMKVINVLTDGSVGNGVNGYPQPALLVANGCKNSVSIVQNFNSNSVMISFCNDDNLGNPGFYFVQNIRIDSSFSILNGPFAIMSNPKPFTAIANSSGISDNYNIVAQALPANETDKRYMRIYRRLSSNTAAFGSQLLVTAQAGLASKIFRRYIDTVNYYEFVIVAHESKFQSTYFVIGVNQKDFPVVNKTLYENGGGIPTKPSLSKVLGSDGFFFSSIVQKGKYLTDDDNLESTTKGISKIEIDFNKQIYNPVNLGNKHLIPSGILSHYDGVSVVEYGFNLYPEDIVATPSTTGGSIVASSANDKFFYSVVYQWTDAQGQIHRSAPSIPLEVSFSGSTSAGSVSLKIPCLSLTEKTSQKGRNNISIVVYRTEVNGSVSYRCTPISTPVFNDATNSTVVFVDTMSDLDLIDNEVLYTTGDVLENLGVGSTSLVATYRNRLAVAGLEDPYLLMFSKYNNEGEAPGFNDVLSLRVDGVGGEITAIQEMDDKFIIFKKNHIYITTGDGPSDTGDVVSSAFSIPQILSTDVGCDNPRSIVMTPNGIMFKSSKGIYLLSRGLSIEYVGAPVEKFNGLNISGATLKQEQNIIIFTTTDGEALVYNYFFNAWSTFTNHESVSAMNWNDKFCFVREDGKVLVEEPNYFKDDTERYPMIYETAWIKLAGLQGYQRIYKAMILGDYKSGHKLRVKVAYDYRKYWEQDQTQIFDATAEFGTDQYGEHEYGEGPYGGETDGVYQWNMDLGWQKCQSIKFLFEDITEEDVGSSYSLADLTLEVGIKKGVNKLGIRKS